MEPRALEKAKSVSVILASIAVPIVLAVVGGLVQKAISDAAMRKDYMQMALEILREPYDKASNPALRGWATEVLSDSAPVPLNTELKTAIASGKIRLTKAFTEENCPPLVSLKDDTFAAVLEKLVEVSQQYNICRIAALAMAIPPEVSNQTKPQ